MKPLKPPKPLKPRLGKCALFVAALAALACLLGLGAATLAFAKAGDRLSLHSPASFLVDI